MLKDKKRFQLVQGEYALIWPNPETGAHDEQAIDLAPECVRFFCKRYGTQENRSPNRRAREVAYPSLTPPRMRDRTGRFTNRPNTLPALE